MLPNIKKSRKLIYLDYAATTPLDRGVKAAMEPFWIDKFGNPSSLYDKGREAMRAVEEARKSVAGLIGARPEEIIFTAGGSESISLAIFGVAREYETKQKKKGHVITTVIEHHSVLRSVQALEQEGWKASYAGVDKEGFIDLKKLQAAVRPDTILISIMYANNEIGTIEPIAEIGKWLKGLNTERANKKLPRIVFHTDACQAAGSLDINVAKLRVDLLSANGSKIYGPKQTGFLYVKSGIKLATLIYGGGQERNLRSGTENVPGSTGLSKALGLAQKNRTKENARLIKLRNYFLDKLFKKIPNIILNGPEVQGEARRLPNNINISFIGAEGEAVILYLDSYNIAASTGSACSTTSADPSHVIMALGRKRSDAASAVRLTLGAATTKLNIDYVMKILPAIVKELRRVTK